MPLNIDPLFSERIRTFETYVDRNKMSTDELYRLYDNNEPIYFHIQNYAEVNAELKQFVESEEFPKFIAQLEKCFAMINEFAFTNHINVETRSSVLTSGAQIVEVNAKVALDKFLNKLKTDYFADRRAILYDGGKKYLEELSMLLNQPDINLEDRKIQLRTLVDDDALERCADGCFSRLQSTVENLKDNLDVNVDGWMRKFIKNQLNEVLQKPELLSGKTPAQKLALISNQRIENNEIHLNNWFKEKLKTELQLWFIEGPNDSYVQATDRYLTSDQASQQQANIELEQVKRNFLNSLTASKFVEFIVSDIYHNFSSILGYMELVNKVENTLKVFGQDESFSLVEIFDTDTFKLKSHLQVFYRTIVFRLLESGFFDKDHVILDEISSNKYQFQFFKKNLLLHLIKQIHSEEPIFLNLLEVINQPQHLKEIYDNIDIHQRNNFFNELIQTPQDFIIFLNNIDTHTLDYFNNDLLKVFENLKTSYNLYFPDQPKIDTSKSFLFTPTFEIIYSILIRLEGRIGEPETIKDFFYNKIIQKNEFKKVLNNYIISTISRIMNYNRMSAHSRLSAYQLINNEIQIVLYNLFDMGMKNFSHIKFYGKHLNYLNNLNCRGCDFSHAIFNVKLDHCIFNEANLNNIVIELESEITHSEFRRSDLADANIYGKIFLCFFNEAQISNTIFYKIENSNFSGTILDKVKFNKLLIVNFKRAQISNTFFYRVEKSDFGQAILDKVEFKELILVNFERSEISNTNFHGELALILFQKANINKTNFNTFLYHADFTESIVSKTKFEGLTEPKFIKANLKEVSIEKICGGDFTGSILESVNFKKIFNDERISEQLFDNFDIYFNDAHLTKVSFNSIQLKGNQIYFSRAKLNDITFKSLDLTEANVHFIDTEFKDVVFDDIKFKDNTIFIDNNFVNVIFRNCDLSQVELNLKDNHDTNIILDKVKLNVFQLVNFYKAGIRDFSTVELKDISDDLIPQSELLPLAHLSTEEKIKTFLSRHKLPGIKLSEQMFEYLISHDFRNFKATDLQLISHETLAKYVIQPDYQFEDANFPDNFSFYNSACSGMQARTKRSLKKFCSRLREMKDDSNTHLIQENEKIIDDMSFLNAQQAWQQNIASILEDLEGNWYPKLMAVKPLKNGNEEVLFINVDTQEERVYELPGRTSITLLERLRSIYQSSFLNRLNEKTQFLEHLAKNINFDPSQFVEPNVSKGDVFETEIGDGSFMLFVALSTKSTIDLIKNNGCPVGTTTAEIECYFNVAFSIQMLTSTGFFVGSLAWQKTLFPNLTKLLSKLALPLMFFQEGFDIYKLGTAKNETGIAQAATALTFDTAMLSLTIAAALGSEIAGPLIVPLVGLSIGIGSLVQNYEALLSSEKAVGKLFNQMNRENKQGGFIRELFTNSSSEYYIQALPTVVIKEIDFNSKRIEFSSAMVRRSITESFIRCPAADPDEHNVFNLRAALGYAETIQLMYPETLTWVLPSMPQFSIFYLYRQAPLIELRHDTEFDTLRNLESLESFYAYKYCPPTTYAIAEIFVKYTQHTLYVNLDRESRNLVIPETKYPQYIHNIIDANTLNDVSCTLYLNAGSGSILLRGGRKKYRWVFNAMSLKSGYVNFSRNSIDIAGVSITLERPQQRYYFLITHEGHTFILDREQQRKILSVINYTQLQNDTQTIQSFITSQAHVQETLSIINYNDSLNYYTGPAFYLTKENSIFFTRDISQDLARDAVLISVSKNSALFFNERLSQLWRTNRYDYRLEANYVFPGKIISISQVENELQILVKHENANYLIVYQLIDIDQPPVLQSVEILNYSPFGIIEDISWSCDFLTSNNNPKKKIDDLLIDLKITDKIYKDREFMIRNNFGKWIKLVSPIPLIRPIRTRLPIPPIRPRLPIPSIPPIVPRPREITWKKVVTWLETSVENNSFTYRAICPNSTINFLGPVLGTIFETNQTLAYFIDKENHQKKGIFLQKIYQEDQFISFRNRPPLYFNYNFKKIFYNKGKPILLMPDDVLNELDSTGNIQIVGFTATWTQRYTTWWKEIFHYLVDKTVSQGLDFIIIQGIEDQQGKALTVLYDPHATCYVLIKENVLNQSLNYRGKIAVDTGYYYYFYLAEKGIIYQYQGITIEKMEDLFQGHKLQKEVPMLEKIAVYQPYYPPGIPTSELTEILNVVPQVLVTSHVWLQTSQGLSLFFDANTQSWQLQRIDYEKWFGRLDSYKFYELNYRVNRLAIDLQLKALTKNEVLLITENHKIKFWVVGNNQVVVPPIQNDIYNWFYLGKSVSDPETYFFFSAYEKKIYFLGSTVACDNDYDYYSDIDITIKSSVKKTMKVNFVDKMDEHSLVLGLNPHEVDGNTIPKLENIESLGLLLSSDLSFTFSLANRTTPFYSRLIYQVSDHKTMSTLELPDNGPWMANKIKNVMNDTVNSGVLVIFNEDQQLSFPLYSENNIFIQVNRGYGAEKKIYRKSLQEINQRVEKSVEPIFIFNAWNVAHVSSFNDSLKTNPGHYQQEMLEMNVPAQLSQTNSESNRIGLSIKDWSAWLGSGLAFVGLGVGGYCAWLFRRRAGHAGYNGAKVVSIGAGSMVLEFNGAHATEYSEERVEQEKVGSNPSLAIGETLQSATIPEMTVNNLEYFAGSFWGNTLLPFASLFSEKMSRQREERYRKLDLEHKIIIRQLEEQLADIERRDSEASETIEVSSTSPKKEWSNNQKAAFMRIIPVITQTEDQFIESLQIKSANTNSKRGVCDFIESGFSFFKSIANTYRSQTKVLQTIFPQS